MASILVIEDERTLCSSIEQSLRMDGHSVRSAPCIRDAAALNREMEFDAVITDVNLVGESGVDFVRTIREEGFDGVVIVMTAYGTIDSAVEAMKAGADEYLQKPIRLEELGLLLTKALHNRRLRSRVRLYESMERVRSEAREMIGDSPAWQKAVHLAERFASIPIPAGEAPAELPTILVLGETGTGKGVIAQYIHDFGNRGAPVGAAPFVHLNCAALPVSLMEGELFGHEKGAFTDAKAARSGLFEMAEGGTIFLDEIGELSLEMQAKLLLVVEKGQFRRLGGLKERRVRARIVAATNHDLEERVEKGAFRRDLFYRLNALTIRLPALRDRAQDALKIAESVLARVPGQGRSAHPRLGESARAAILRHTWPGNIRELINSVRRASILCDGGVIEADDLGIGQTSPQTVVPRVNGQGAPANGNAPTSGSPQTLDPSSLPLVTVDDMERALILRAVQQTRGNISLAAKLIGLHRGALRYRIERLGLDARIKELYP